MIDWTWTKKGAIIGAMWGLVATLMPYIWEDFSSYYIGLVFYFPVIPILFGVFGSVYNTTLWTLYSSISGSLLGAIFGFLYEKKEKGLIIVIIIIILIVVGFAKGLFNT